jgi:acyl-CoA oxidase
MGLHANHCVLYAQLIIEGKSYGVQPFFVQIRSRETHLPLPGFELGDIGPKLGYSSKDNGYMRIDNVRIPRENLV